MKKTYYLTILITVLLLLSLAQPTSAQPTYSVQTFNIRDGLAANLISSMRQAADGLIWVSTWNGLSCYDGYQFSTFRDQEGIGETLSSHRIIRINTDVNSNVWCVTFDNRLYRFDTHECRYYDVSEMISRKNGGRAFAMRNIYPLQKGVSWITADHDLVVARIDDNCSLNADAVELLTLDSKGEGNNFVHRVVEDLDGREWILSDHYVMLYGTDLRIDGYYEYLRQLGDRVYMATPDGRLGYWQKGQKTLQTVSLPASVKAITCLETLDRAAGQVQKEHCLLIGTDKGLMAIDSRGGVSLLCPQSVARIFIDSRQRVWMLCSDGSIAVVGNASKRYYQVPVNLSAPHPVIFLEDSQQTIWAVTDAQSAYYYDEQKEAFLRAAMSQTGTGAASTLQIKRYFIDSQKNLWFSSQRDLSVMRFHHHGLRFVELKPDDEVRALATDGQQRLFVGAGDGNIIVYNSQARQQGYLTANGQIVQQPVAFSKSKVYALTFDSQKRLWVGTRGDGLYCVDRERGTVSHLEAGGAEGLNCADVYAIDEDAHGRLWIGTYGGGLQQVVPSQAGTGTVFTLLAGTGPASTSRAGTGPAPTEGFDAEQFCKVRRITHDSQDRVLVSTTGGLLVSSPSAPSSPSSPNSPSSPSSPSGLSSPSTPSSPLSFCPYTHVKGDTTTLLTSDVMETCLTRSGHLLVATMGGGMQECEGGIAEIDNLRFRRLRQFTADEGNVLDMVEDGYGIVWVVRETTIDRYDPATGSLQQVGRNDLADRTEFTEAQPVYDAQTGRVAIAAMGGFVFFDPHQLKATTHVPRIVFTSVRYHGEQTEHPLLNGGRLHVDSNRRNLSIRFAALDYKSNDLVSYAYRLEGIESDWNYLGLSHEASFSRLPAGTHRLLVRSTNSDGEWQDNVAELVIEADPTFWESWMGTLLKVLAVVALVLVAFHIYRLRQQIRLERQMNSMKTNFYEDVSQQLRVPLTQIGDIMPEDIHSSDEAATSLEQVQQQAQQMLAIVDEKINEYELAPPEVIDEDTRMMEQLMAYLDDHIGDSALKIEDLATSVRLGRSVFYGKVKAMTGMSPVDFVRHLRIKRASDLLERSQYTVSQIAYQVGFTDPKYFSKCFKKETGLTPSEFRDKTGKEPQGSADA